MPLTMIVSKLLSTCGYKKVFIRTVAFLHDTLDGDQPLVKERRELGRVLPLDMPDLNTANILHLYRIPIIAIVRLPDKPHFFSVPNKPRVVLQADDGHLDPAIQLVLRIVDVDDRVVLFFLEPV